MKLKELITGNSWLSVKLTLIDLYPDQENNIDSYEDVYELLKVIAGIENNTVIKLTRYNDGKSTEENYVDVSGVDGGNQNDHEQMALEFVTWGQWLGMSINTETLAEFSELEIISHCLYEMTFISYDEGEIQEKFSELQKEIDELENMSEEERKKHTSSLG